MSLRKFSFFCLCLALTACASTPSPEAVKMSEALCVQGKFLLANGEAAQARDVYESAVTRDGDNARAWNGLGVAEEMLKHSDKAEIAYRRALDLTPGDVIATNNLAHVLIAEGKESEAVILLAPYKDDGKAPLALRQNLAKAESLQAQQAAQKAEAAGEIYADLGSYPTEAMAEAHLYEAKKAAGDDAEGLHFAVVPEVKVTGGVPTFTVHVTGAKPSDICGIFSPLAFPCIPHGK
ncbi:MAG: tetratricopeptide repeat protein [Alphaproteobacteria bacterium]|nr:tetratricopeptide repeat protein [Alphaproteobacteria bacterium]